MVTTQLMNATAWPHWLAVVAEPVTTIDEDRKLVEQAQRDLRLFNQLYERHVERVYRYVLVRVGNVPDAQDVTSQTFLAAMESLHRYQGKQPFLAWLFGIARHKTVDLYRRQKPEADLATAVSLSDPDDAPADIVGQRLQVEVVAQKLRTLSPDRAEAISLRLFGGLELPEIAELMGKQETAVRMLIHRGLRDLQAQLLTDGENAS